MENQYSVIDEMRADTSAKTQGRRQIAAQAAIGLIDFSIISLFQMGFLKSIPDVPGKIFASHKVNTSKHAVLLGIPDGVLGLCAYTGTMLLAVAASRKSRFSGFFDFLLGGILIGQAAGGAHYLYNLATVQKKVCVYCVTGALVNFAAVKPFIALLTAKA